jgi:uncharacterized RDD family membrane protein YckC
LQWKVFVELGMVPIRTTKSMSWYYAESGKSVGPFSEQDWQGLLQRGAIQSDTLVWREGMPEWKRYEELAGGGVATEVPAAIANRGNVVACSECGQVLPEEETVRYGNASVCANCKPVFVQRLRQGVASTGALHYAGFWIRAGAYIVDALILLVVNLALSFVVGAMTAGIDVETEPGAFLAVQFLLMLLQLALGAGYEVWFLGRFGATPGKMACGLRVVTSDGGRISYLRAFGRYLGKIVSFLIFGIGFLMAAFDPEKRTLHDRMADTRVVIV